MAERIWPRSGVSANFTYTSVPPLKSTPKGMPCQKKIESSPATLKISEKARKYHFLPRKSILVLRNNSTASLLQQKFLPASSAECPHHGGTEGTEFYKTLLTIPPRRTGTLKLINNPTCIRLSRR